MKMPEHEVRNYQYRTEEEQEVVEDENNIEIEEVAKKLETYQKKTEKRLLLKTLKKVVKRMCKYTQQCSC